MQRQEDLDDAQTNSGPTVQPPAYRTMTREMRAAEDEDDPGRGFEFLSSSHTTTNEKIYPADDSERIGIANGKHRMKTAIAVPLSLQSAAPLAFPPKEKPTLCTPRRSSSADFLPPSLQVHGGTPRKTRGPSDSGNSILNQPKTTTAIGAIRKTMSTRSMTMKPGGNSSHSKGVITLDELLDSHHRPRRRQRLSARGRRKQDLRKSLSQGDILRDVSFRSNDILDLKQSLHGVVEQRQSMRNVLSSTDAERATNNEANSSSRKLLAESSSDLVAQKLANMFEKAIQQESHVADRVKWSETQLASFVAEVRALILGLSLDDMITVVKHLDDCQSSHAPVRWNFLRDIIDKDHTVDWEKLLFVGASTALAPHAGRRMFESKSTMVTESNHGESSSACEYFEESWVSYYEEEEEESSGCSSSASWLRSEDGGADYLLEDDDDDDDNASDISGISLEAYTEHCDSSVTMLDFLDVEFEESFAVEDDDPHGEVVIEVAVEQEAYDEIIEESFVVDEEDILEIEEEVVEEEASKVDKMSPVEPELSEAEMDTHHIHSEEKIDKGSPRNSFVFAVEKERQEASMKTQHIAGQSSSPNPNATSCVSLEDSIPDLASHADDWWSKTRDEHNDKLSAIMTRGKSLNNDHNDSDNAQVVVDSEPIDQAGVDPGVYQVEPEMDKVRIYAHHNNKEPDKTTSRGQAMLSSNRGGEVQPLRSNSRRRGKVAALINMFEHGCQSKKP